MDYQKIAQIYNKIVYQRFEHVRIIFIADASGDHGVMFGALGITNNFRREFSKFLLTDFADKADQEGIDLFSIIPFSIEETKRLFPEEWQKIQLEMNPHPIEKGSFIQYSWTMAQENEVDLSKDPNFAGRYDSNSPVDKFNNITTKMASKINNAKFMAADKTESVGEQGIAA